MLHDHRSDKSMSVLYRALEKLADQEFAGQVKDMAFRAVADGSEKTASEQVYADQFNAKLPVSSLEETVLSKIYFDCQTEKLAEHREAGIRSRLDTYLNLYEVPEDLFKHKEAEKTAHDTEPRYLLPSLQLCKVASGVDLEKASQLFDTEHQKLNVAERVEFAKNYVKLAREWNKSEYTYSIAKYAGLLDTDLESLQAMLEARAAAVSRRNEDGSLYTKLAFDLKQLDSKPDKEELEKLAGLIQVLDEDHGLDSPQYDNRLPCAYGSVFNKEAQEDGSEGQSTIPKAEIVAQYGDGVLEMIEDEDGEIDVEKFKEIKRLHGID